MIKDKPKYEEWLTTIANTRFVYNTMDELEDYLDCHSIHSNGIKRAFPTQQKLRSAYRDLKVEVSLMTAGNISLGQLMEQYKKAWDFYRANLARRSNPAHVAVELLRYCCSPSCDNDVSEIKRTVFSDVLDQDIDIPFLVLMLFKAVPGYKSKNGEAVDMPSKYEDVLDMLERFAEGAPLVSIKPSIARAREEKYKSRLMLYYHVSNILETYESYLNNAKVYETANNIKDALIDLNIAGYWNECGGGGSNTSFWQIHRLSPGTYFAIHWHKDADNRLVGARFTMFFYEEADGHLMLYVLHPEAIMHRIQGLGYGDSDHVWYATEMPEDDSPDYLPFKRVSHSNEWNLELNLTRVTDESVINTYNNWFTTCQIHNPYERSEYEFRVLLYAVTVSHLYIISENEGEYYKVPRDANEGFANIKIGDMVGLLKMNKTIYLAFDELLLYIPNTPEELAKYNIERVNYIE